MKKKKKKQEKIPKKKKNNYINKDNDSSKNTSKFSFDKSSIKTINNLIDEYFLCKKIIQIVGIIYYLTYLTMSLKMIYNLIYKINILVIYDNEEELDLIPKDVISKEKIVAKKNYLL